MSLLSKMMFIYNRIKIRYMSPRQRYTFEINNFDRFKRHKLFLLTDGYIELPNEISGGTFFDGYFQSPKYFNEIRNDLLKELTPVHNYTDEELEFIQKIKNTESVCVTIRLGDYINNLNFPHQKEL
ncbi:hypothetical protein IMAU50151_02055 [Lactobacillus helveticus]|nr:hypothetical protein [Lactobacillus helveticus]